jgi:hypothetical protein
MTIQREGRAAVEALQDAATDLRESAQQEARQYANGQPRPLGGYAVLLGAYAASVGVLSAIVRRRGGLPERVDKRDLVMLGLATHKLSRLLSKDTVTSVVRAPFTRFEEESGEGELREQVRGDGVRHATGDLLSCPFCLALWVATGLAFGLVLAPRATRLASAILTAVTGSDFLQLAYAAAQQAGQDR